MKILIIETSQVESFIALSIDEKCEMEHLPPFKQRDHLFPALHRLLEKAGIKLCDLDLIAVGEGPGSFTGGRIGNITAKMLSFSQNLPLVSFCSFAPWTPKGSSPFRILTDAKTKGFCIYDGTSVWMEKEPTFPSNMRLYSPHPEMIIKRLSLPTKPASLHFSFLLGHVKEKFLQGNVIDSSDLSVCYLDKST